MTHIQRALLLAACVVSSCLAACGGGSSADSSAPPSGPNNPPPSPPPRSPALPTAIRTDANDGKVIVDWLEQSGVTYTVYWSTQAGAPLAQRTAVAGNKAKFAHTELTNGTTYYYVVTAVDDGVESEPSLEYEATPAPGMAVSCEKPDWDAVVGAEDLAMCNVDTTFELARASVRIGGNEVELHLPAPDCEPADEFCGMSGPLPLANVPFGSVLLVATVTDILGTTMTESYVVAHDEPPVVELIEPPDYEVARPFLHVEGSCEDDDPAGCALIRVSGDCEGRNPELALVAGDSFDDDVSFTEVDGCKVTVQFDGYDSADQRAERPPRTVLVESSANLSVAAQVPGRILDANAERILFLDSSSGHGVLTIRDRMLGTDEMVLDDAGAAVDYGYLAPLGAIFVARTTANPITSLFEWRDAALFVLGEPSPSGSLKADGDYAIWQSGPGGGTLIRRNLLAGTSLIVTDDAGSASGNRGVEDCDVAADGDVVYWSRSTFDIFRFDGTSLLRLTDDPSDFVQYLNPVTDGNVVAYARVVCCDAGEDSYEIAMHDGTVQTILTSQPGSRYVRPQQDYAVSNGWLAFTDLRPSGTRQVMARASDGTVVQVSLFSDTSAIDALAPDGQIALVHATRRYLSAPPYADVIEVSSDLRDGPLFWQSGALFVALGRYVFEVVP